MRKRLPSALIAAVVALVVSIVLPLAINLVTGGTPPHALKPYHRFYWPVIIFAGLIVALFAVRQRLSANVPTEPASQLHPQNRVNALAQVQARINERLESSLTRLARLTLDLEDSSESIVRPEHLMVQPVVSETDETVPRRDIMQSFIDVDESLLLLGDPGSGKTTLLLELAQELHDKAVGDDNAALPLILDLASWAAEQPAAPAPSASRSRMSAQPSLPALRVSRLRRMLTARSETAQLGGATGHEPELRDWLLAETRRLYKVPRRVVEGWLQSRKVTLLFDGLDEMRPRSREECVKAINKFQDLYNVPSMAVSSRAADYEALRGRLSLQGAVRIRPLNRAQIETYLETAGDRLSGVRTALTRDRALWELLDSPLMLNVMVLAYHDRPASDVELGTTLDERRRRLINAYVTEVLSRRQAPSARYSISETARWLSEIAYCAGLPSSAMPLRRSLLGWRMTWHRAAPESRVRLMLSAFFPWLVGLSFSFGVVVPITLSAGSISTAASVVPSIIFGCGYVLLTKPVRHRKYYQPLAYPAMRRNGIIAGGSLAVLYFAGITLVLRVRAFPAGTILPLVIGAALIVLFTIALAIENIVAGGLIEWIYWGAILVGLACLYLIYRWHPSLALLTEYFLAGLIVGLGFASFLWIAFLAADLDDETRLVQRHLDWRAVFVPVVLAGSAYALSFSYDEHTGTYVLVPAIGMLAGMVWAMPASFILVRLCDRIFSIFAPVLACLDLVPLRLRKFLEYSVDRSLLYRSRGGYSFIHAIFQEYFSRGREVLLARRDGPPSL